jgi:hypothetical protein
MSACGKLRSAILGLACAAAAMGQTAPALLLHPDYKPMNARERLNHYLAEAFYSPERYVGELSAAAADQFHKAPPEWGLGAEGYAKRAASEFGVVLIETSVREGLAAGMGLESRYIKCACRGFVPRAAHAIKMSFLTYDRDGRTRIDLPVMAGDFAGGMISQYWYPSRFNPLSDGVRVGTQQFGIHVGADVLREFSPEIRKALHLKP